MDKTQEYNPDNNPIQITCDVAETLTLDEIQDFQGILKTLSTGNRDKIVSSICQEGFMVPFFIWNDNGKTSFTMEYDPHFCDVIVNRYKNWCEINRRGCIVKLNGEEWNG